jgi:hypothetical protein
VRALGKAPSVGGQNSDDWFPGTASMASGLSYSSFVPDRSAHKNKMISIIYNALPEILAERIRIQNLRFAHFLCAAQEMSGLTKR